MHRVGYATTECLMRGILGAPSRIFGESIIRLKASESSLELHPSRLTRAFLGSGIRSPFAPAKNSMSMRGPLELIYESSAITNVTRARAFPALQCGNSKPTSKTT